jgi:hypothetical protein
MDKHLCAVPVRVVYLMKMLGLQRALRSSLLLRHQADSFRSKEDFIVTSVLD